MLQSKRPLDIRDLIEGLEDGAGIIEPTQNLDLFTIEEAMIFAEAGTAVARVARQFGSDYHPGPGFGSSLSLFRLVANLERCVGPRKYRILEISPGGTWFGMLALNLGHSYAATETRPEFYVSRSLLLRYFAGENFSDWAQLDRQPTDLAKEATLIPWWAYIGMAEKLSLGVDIVLWREPTAADMRYDIDFVLRLSRLMLKTSELGLFICRYPEGASRERLFPLLSHYEKFGFKKSFTGKWCGFVPEELPSDPRLAALGAEPAPYTPSDNDNRFTTDELISGALAHAIYCASPAIP